MGVGEGGGKGTRVRKWKNKHKKEAVKEEIETFQFRQRRRKLKRSKVKGCSRRGWSEREMEGWGKEDTGEDEDIDQSMEQGHPGTPRKAYKAAYIWELLPWTSPTLSRTQRFHLRWFYIRKQCFPPARPVTSAFNRLFKETKFIILKTEPHVRVVSTVTVASVQTYLKVFLNACTLKSRCKYTIKEYKSPEKMALFPIRILLSFPRGVESEPAAEAARWNK